MLEDDYPASSSGAYVAMQETFHPNITQQNQYILCNQLKSLQSLKFTTAAKKW
jgi:hypothetical protein